MEKNKITSYAFSAAFALVAVSPIPFGSVHVWAWSSIVAILGAITLFVAFSTAAQAGNYPVSTRMTWPFMAVCALVTLWIFIQIWRGVPATWQHPIWAEAASVLKENIGGSISVTPASSFSGLIKLLGYVATFWLAVQAGRDPGMARRILKLLITGSIVCAVYGLAVKFFGINRVLWLEKYAYQDDLTSTFINRNNYATFAGLGWLCVLALSFDAYSSFIERTGGRQERLRNTILFVEKTGWKFGLLFIIQAAALIYSHSRAGLASSVLGLAAFCVALALGKTADKKTTSRFALASIGFVVLLFAASGHVVDERLGSTDLATEQRPIVYAATMRAIADQPFLGTGLGSFEDIFRFYRPTAIVDVFAQAHNSYLETALELGIPATALLILVVMYVFAMNLYGARTRRRDVVFPCVGIGATVLVGTHALVDFSIQIPAVALTYVTILGVSFAQSWTTRRNSAF